MQRVAMMRMSLLKYGSSARTAASRLSASDWTHSGEEGGWRGVGHMQGPATHAAPASGGACAAGRQQPQPGPACLAGGRVDANARRRRRAQQRLKLARRRHRVPAQHRACREVAQRELGDCGAVARGGGWGQVGAGQLGWGWGSLCGAAHHAAPTAAQPGPQLPGRSRGPSPVQLASSIISSTI